ncbi:hypothetical protein JHD93_09415 [Cronobacter sakazakii]|uniref:hypothetical protein n=1 Tax=Cronobacter sakazakii TaxID=28141 RepID=UPI00190D0611|nr:hypothetical protein [Cronobacter sakazakii]MBK4112378.1 hypothetical protein [Cronobacter sakazakii]
MNNINELTAKLEAIAQHAERGWQEAHEQEARAEAAEKRVVELETSHKKLREALAAMLTAPAAAPAEITALERQRDELLAALEGVVPLVEGEWPEGHWEAQSILDAARSAIGSAKDRAAILAAAPGKQPLSVDVLAGALRNAPLSPSDNQGRQRAPVEPEWTNQQCLEFLSIAFRHAEIKGDFELDDLRLGVKMANAMTPGKEG